MGHEIERKKDIVIIRLAGNLTLGGGEQEFRDCVYGAIEQGCRKLVLDLSKVERLDSTGLGELVHARSLAERKSAQIRLLSPSDNVMKLLRLTHLDSVFPIFNDEVQAFDGF